MKPLEEIAVERQSQIERGFDATHDDSHGERQMAIAATCYLLAPGMVRIEREWVAPDTPKNWPWHFSWWRPGFYRQNLVKVGALIVAEIERLDRAEAKLRDCPCGADCTAAPEGPMHNCPYVAP